MQKILNIALSFNIPKFLCQFSFLNFFFYISYIYLSLLSQTNRIYIHSTFSQGMVIGAVLAVDQETAQRAARLVRVDYEDLPALITMEEVGGILKLVSQYVAEQ